MPGGLLLWLDAHGFPFGICRRQLRELKPTKDPLAGQGIKRSIAVSLFSAPMCTVVIKATRDQGCSSSRGQSVLRQSEQEQETTDRSVPQHIAPDRKQRDGCSLHFLPFIQSGDPALGMLQLTLRIRLSTSISSVSNLCCRHTQRFASQVLLILTMTSFPRYILCR